jgi:hypothetical protein
MRMPGKVQVFGGTGGCRRSPAASTLKYAVATVLAVTLAVGALLVVSPSEVGALPLAPGEEQYLPWGTYGPCHPDATHIRTRGGLVVEVGKSLATVPHDGIDVLECRPFDGPGGTRIVACPANSLYTYCLLNENDGVGNHVFLGVREGPPQAGPPTSPEGCKGEGWRQFNLPRAFKNQGDCIQFVNVGK